MQKEDRRPGATVADAKLRIPDVDAVEDEGVEQAGSAAPGRSRPAGEESDEPDQQPPDHESAYQGEHAGMAMQAACRASGCDGIGLARTLRQ